MKAATTRIALALLLAFAAFAQQGSNGSISGTVTDPSGQAVPAAKVKVVSELNGDEKSTLTNDLGDFFFPAMVPGGYTVRVEAQGFRPLESKGNVLAAAGRLALGKLQLEVGAVTESVLVTAQTAQVATTTTAQATTIDSKQMDLIVVKGRDPMSVFKTLPGVTVINDQDTWGGSFQSTVPTFQGRGGNTVYTDGVNGGDGGGGSNFSGITSIDAISEVNIQANSYAAEYGFKGGAQVNMITKHGGSDFHGSAAYYKRHEQFNAQNYFNNRTGAAKPRYRYDDYSGTIGGPVPVRIPILNRDKKSMNFFYSVEQMSLKDVNQLRQYTMPTALERNGDFSQTRAGGNPTGNLVTVRDPLTGQPFSGNIIPASRRDPLGVSLMNIFPLPNVAGATGYNYLTQEPSIDHPRRAQLMRFDIRPTDKDTFSVKYQNWFTKSVGWEVAGRSSPWGLVRQRYDFTADQGKVEWTRVWNSHLVMEASIGIFYSTEGGPPEDDLALASIQKAYDRNAALGSCAPPAACPATGSLKPSTSPLAGLKQIAPRNNPLGLIPRVSLGTLQNNSQAVPDIAFDGRWPITGADTSMPINLNFTYTLGAHIFKAGVTRVYERFGQARSGTFAGQFDFSNDGNDPLNSGFALANMYLGHVTSYTESMGRVPDNRRQYTWGWYIQDTWKARRNLTIDYGLRMYKWSPALQGGREASAFSFNRFDPSWGGKPPVYYRPSCVGNANPCSGTNRKAMNPLSGELLPSSFIGLMVPGTGYSCGPITPDTPCKINGIVVQDDPTYTDVGHGFINQLPIQFDPRVGVAWDPKGDSKMVVRLGFGVFHDSTGGPTNTGGPAYRFDQVVRYTDMNSYYLGQGPTSPTGVSGYWLDGNKRPVTYQYNFGIQRDMGLKTILDVAYVGSNTHHNYQNYNFNALPAGARFMQQNRDVTVAATAANPGALPDNFLRPIVGFGDINISYPGTTERYDSLQVSATRRFANSFQFTGAYTWAGGTSNGWFQNNPLPSSVARQRNALIQKEAAVFSYTWDLPRGSKLLPGAVSKQVLDGWQLQGISTFATGQVSNISAGTADGFDFTGGGESCGTYVQTGNAVLARGDRGIDNWFNTSVFHRPIGRGDIGNNCNNGKFLMPGFNNHDLSLFKVFRFSESKSLQFRWETFNTFNHTQFSSIGTTAQWSAAGAQTNNTFGKATAARDGRKMMFGLRFLF